MSMLDEAVRFWRPHRIMLLLLLAPLSLPLVPAGYFRDVRYILLTAVAVGALWLLSSESLPTWTGIRQFLCRVPNLPLVCLLIWSLAGFALAAPLWNAGFQLAIREVARLLVFAGFFWGTRYLCRSRSDFGFMAEAVLWGTVLAAGAVMASYYLSGGGDAAGTFENSQFSAAHLLVLVPMAAAQLRFGDTQRRSVLALLATFMSVAALVMTRERTAWLAGAAALLVVGAFSLWRLRRQVRDLRFALVTALLVFAAVGSVVAVGVQGDRHTFARALDLQNPQASSSGRWRLHMWGISGALIRQHPITGLGPGAMPQFIGEYYDFPKGPDGSRWTTVASYTRVINEAVTLSNNPHSQYLVAAGEYGLIGAILFAAIFTGLLFLFIHRSGRATGETCPRLLAGGSGALTGQLIAMFFNPGWGSADLMALSGLLLGLTTAAVTASRTRA